jgi:hypothetical protein
MKNKRDWAGLIGGGMLIFSLFMPWISGGAFSQDAIDITYGYALLSFGVLACSIAAFKIITKKSSIVSFIYPILGVLSGLVLYQNYIDLARNAQRIVNDFPFLSDFVHGFIGAGVYVGLFGCAVMIGSLFIRPE